jgi:peroxiredoxin
MTLTAGADGPANAPTINDFALQDHKGHVYHLSDFRAKKAVVVAFLGVDCPIAELYAPRLKSLASEFGPKGVGFLAIDSNEHDSADDIARYAGRHELPFPLLTDPDQKAADLLGARKTPEAFVLDAQHVVRYRGRIDDQYAVGGRRAQPGRRDLAVALEQLLAGLAITQPITPTSGCVIDRPRSKARGRLTYCRDIASILQEHCVLCHRPGRMAPFSLLTYSQARRRAESICLAID